MKKNIFITGPPGIGKTTLIKKLAIALTHLSPIGFYTEEIREGGIRIGFRLIGLDSSRSILSHMDFRGRSRVGKYRVDVDGFESFLRQLDLLQDNAGLVIIDEIGKMECFSDYFSRLVYELFDSDSRVIATVAAKGSGLIGAVKNREDAVIYEVTINNRNTLVPIILKAFNA